jgi:hypothetical protein
MKRFLRAIRNFFLPPPEAKTWRRILPLAVVAVVMLLFFTGGLIGWEETNTSSFCGLTCHTMPPQYITHNMSAHTNVACEDCHMGRDKFGVLLPRKIAYSWQTGTAMLTGSYEYPIVAKNMAPARQACENCHKPEVFTSDKLVEIAHYSDDEANTRNSTFLSVKTGGGSSREGLGHGIHWHIENPVNYYPTDKTEQEIPYVVVVNEDGTTTEYIDIESDFDPSSIEQEDLQEMDCITCHNRTAHMIDSPDKITDKLIENGLVSKDIPFIKKQALAVMSEEYETTEAGLAAIEGLKEYYNQNYGDFASANEGKIDQAVTSLKDAYEKSHFPDQKMDWKTHPNNLGHVDDPGCFRCHDGKHLNSEGEAIRLECNICHSIPVVSEPFNLTASLELSKGFEPENHKNPNWITIHRDVFDETCAGCHTVDDPGGTSNTSFCSNSACHGSSWTFAGFDAPAVREALAGQISALITPTPEPTEVDDIGVGGESANVTPTPEATSEAPAGPLTYASLSGVLTKKCGSCHGQSAMKGLNVLTYDSLMAGGDSGPVIAPGDPDNSLLVKIQKGKHFGQFTPEELDQVIQWISEGALEK